MEHFFKDFFQSFRVEPSSGSGLEWGDWTPLRVALTEYEKEFRLTASVPGMTKEHIEVKLSGDLLILGGSKENEAEDGEQRRTERTYGSFYRSLRLPADIARDDIQAEIKDGVLTLRMPKSRAARQNQRQAEVEQV